MSGKVVTKIRIVKCPKCRQLLPEPQGYSVYKCGGCGTDLEAKRQSLVVNSDSSIQEMNAAPGKASDLVFAGKQHIDRKRQVLPRKDSLKDKATASSREHYLDGNGEYNGDQLVPFKFTDEEELESELDIPKLLLRRHRMSNKGGPNNITRCEIEEITNNGEFSLERPEEDLICSSDEDGNSDKSALIGDRPEMEITETNFGNLSLEGADAVLISGSDEEDANKEKSVTEGANPEVEIIGNDLEGVEDLNNGNLPLEDFNSGINGEDANSDKSALVGKNLEGEITGNNIAGEKLNNGKWSQEGEREDLNIEDPNNDQSAIEDTKSEVDTTEGTTTKNASNEIEIVDTLDTTELRDHSSEFSGVHGKEKLSKSSTTRSSYTTGSLMNAYTVAEGMTRKGKGLANSSSYGDLGTQHQSHMPHEKNHVMKDSAMDKNKVLDNTKHGNSRWVETKRDHKFPSSMPYRSGYESGRPSNGVHDKGSSFLSHNSREDTDQEKMKLMRMVLKLQDQLDKTRYMSQETNGRVSAGASYKGIRSSAYQYHSHDLHEGRFSHALDHSRCIGRCNHGIASRQRHKYSRIPYSAEATSCAHHVDHSCYHCCSRVLADSSPRVHFQHEDLYTSYPAQNCCPSSPQCFSETNSDFQRHRATVVRKYLRDKHNLAKQHYKPVAGGAPFITCHKCSNLLQLPADFLLYKRVCHKLKCGQCSEVLKFSLKNGSHVVPFSLNTIGLPSRELHPRSEVISGSNIPSVSHVNYYQYSPAKPISYYDDYGLSVSRSFSSEVDLVSLTQQIHPLNGGKYVNPNVSPSSTFKANIVASRYFNAIAAPTDTDESAGFSSSMSETRKLSAEKEVKPPQKGTLHKLMGYSTPSKVIRGASC